MERTFAEIEADIASLRANAVKYRKLAEHRRAAGHFMFAEKLIELLAELEAKLAAHRQQFALPRDRKRAVLAIDHRAAFGPAHLPSLLDKKSFSTFNWPICR